MYWSYNITLEQIISARDFVYSYLENRLTQTHLGRKNAFLYFQQALCLGEINAVHDVIIDESRFLSDPTLGTDVYATERNNLEAALRIDCHYAGGIVDSIMAANMSERKEASFDDIAYASVAVRLDRENPQFSSVPTLQFLIEGRKIRFISRTGTIGNYLYQLSTERVYSNNPSYVLLDYLLLDISEASVDISEIDLESFYNAAQVCATIVQTGVSVGGHLYRTTDGSRNIFTRDIPLYECNIVIDTNKSVRDNIESILTSMGDARLIWSQGKYKLSLAYPTSNETIPWVLELNDDNIVSSKEIEIAWPNASERFNQCTVKFSNEANDFVDDSVSWPPKLTPTTDITNPNYNKTITETIGLGGFRYGYGLANSGWEESEPGGVLLNNFSVWDGSNYTSNMQFLIIVRKGDYGIYTFEYAFDDNGVYSITDLSNNQVLLSENSPGGWRTKYTRTITLGDPSNLTDKVYRLSVTAADDDGETANDNGDKAKGRGYAAKLSKNNTVYWNTRDPVYTNFATRTLNNKVYCDMLIEDNGIELETEVYAEAVTDAYHALAKAEEIVRTSRGTFTVKLTYQNKGYYLEPGDFVKISSDVLKIGLTGPIYFRVAEVKLNSDFTSEVTLNRFDSSFLAWNTKDDELVIPPALYEGRVPAPMYVLYSANKDNILNSSGRLDWPHISISDKQGYIVYMLTNNDAIDGQLPEFLEIGRTENNYFNLPAINAFSAVFGIKTVTKDNRMSAMTYTNRFTVVGNTSTITAVLLYHTSARGVNLSAPASTFVKDPNGQVTPSSIIFTAETGGFQYPQYRWYVDGILQSVPLSSSTFTLQSFSNVSSKVISVAVSSDETFNDAVGDSLQILYLEESVGSYSINTSDPNILLSADSSGTLRPNQLPKTVTVSVYNGTSLIDPVTATYEYIPTNCTITNSSNTFTVTGITGSFASVLVDVTIGGTTIATTVVITKLSDGGTSVGLVLSDPVVALQANADGSLAPNGLDIAEGQLTVYKDGVDITSTATLSVVGNNATGTINTAADTPVATKPKGYYKLTNIIGDRGSLVFTAVVDSISYSITYYIIKLRGGYEVLNTLPTTNLFEGRLVYLATAFNQYAADKLYRYTGSGWSTDVATTDTITAGQIDANGLDVSNATAVVDGNTIAISTLAANALVPALNYVGEYSTAPTSVMLGSNWKQNALYKNTLDSNSYVLTGNPLGWVLYLESGAAFDLSIESSAGTVFRVGSNTQTTLSARLFKNGAEVTDQTPASWFRWRRVSAIPQPSPNDDATWNSQYTSGFKVITINVDSVYARATFFCDIISS